MLGPSHFDRPSSAQTPRSMTVTLTRATCQRCISVCLALVAYGTLGGLVNAHPYIHAQVMEEGQVRAAYLYNIAKFVEWPPAAFHGPDDPIQLCAIGDDATIDILQAAVTGKRVNGRPIQARRLAHTGDLGTCHILFVGVRDKNKIAVILRKTASLPTVTVGQSDSFIPLGGMINLASESGVIKLEAAPATAEAAGLRISSRLLLVARIVMADGRWGSR